MHHACAVFKSSAAIGAESGSRPLELLFNLRAGERLKSAKRFAGGWIDGRDGNDEFPPY